MNGALMALRVESNERAFSNGVPVKPVHGEFQNSRAFLAVVALLVGSGSARSVRPVSAFAGDRPNHELTRIDNRAKTEVEATVANGIIKALATSQSTLFRVGLAERFGIGNTRASFSIITSERR